jgi:hypothetical protein
MTFTKRSGGIAAVVTGATLVPLVAFGGVGLAKSSPSASEYQYSPSANQYKVRVCHYTHSHKHPWVIINISKSALAAHVKHGDALLADGATTCGPKSTTVTTTTHGKSGSNGNNGHHGKP